MKDSDKNMNNKPIVTCAGDWNLFCTLEATLVAAIPQDSCEWRRSYGRVVKPVFLEATFVKFGKEHLPNDKAWNLLKQPILHIYWTDCVDLESYKTTLRDNIEAWMKQLNQRGVSDWLIVLVETYDIRKTNKLIPRTTVLDKIRSDFTNKQTEDRCISVINPIKSESRSAESWRGLVARVRHLILTAYTKTLLKFEEYMREQRDKRNDPEWDFSKYFMLQEQLAFVFEMLSLYDEALVQYDELDALFTQFVLNSSITQGPKWLDTFRQPVQSWQSVKLGSLVPLQLRDLIVKNKASLLDFRSYLYQRQCAMLLLTFKPWEMSSRCLNCIHNTLKELQLLEVTVAPGGVSCWAMLMCSETIRTIEHLLKSSNNLSRNIVELCTANQAPLFHYAKDKLYELGKQSGLLPGTPEPSSEQLHLVVMLSAGMGDSDTNQQCSVDRLKKALCSKESFQKYYLELSELAMGTYKHIGRLRFARLIGRELAAFYSELGERNKAIVFLLDALRSYQEQDWKQLAAQTRLELVACYNNPEDLDRYTKLSAAIASSLELEILVRHFYFDEMMKSIKQLNISNSSFILCEMEDCFRIVSVELLSSKQQLYVTDNKATWHLVIESLLPRDVVCTTAKISLHTHTSAMPLMPGITAEQLKPSHPFMNHLKIASHLHYKEDGTLEKSTVGCYSPKTTLKRSDSSKYRKASAIQRADFTKCLNGESILINNGLNEIILETVPCNAGNFKLGQISFLVEGKLEYLSNVLVGANVGFEVVAENLSVVLNKVDAKKELIAGLERCMVLVVKSGSTFINENSHITITTSKGLIICRSDETTEMSRKLTVDIKSCTPFETISIPLRAFVQLQTKKDDKSIEHKVWLHCSWLETTTEVLLHFSSPFTTTHRLLTSHKRKFIQVTVKSCHTVHFVLSEPQLTCQVKLADVNPKHYKYVLSQESNSVSFLWEILNDLPERSSTIKADFAVNYKTIEQKSCLNSIVRESNDKCHCKCHTNESDLCHGGCGDCRMVCPCEKFNWSQSRCYTSVINVPDFSTLFIVKTRVEPPKGSEFCRAQQMCLLHLAVQRVNETEYTSLMYEVLADQSMWAICGQTAGVITVNNEDTEAQNVTLEVMPLSSGYLPLPAVRLSKFIMPNVKDGSHPRLEPFTAGQVYHSGKALQIHVLAASS